MFMDFQQIYNRKQTNSLKWDHLKAVFQTDDIIPLWVADMDFKAPEEVNQALIERATHGIYGYTIITEEIKDIVTNWVKNRHNWQINNRWLTFSPSVLTSLHIAIQSFTNKNDKIMIQTPVYTPFFNLLKNGNREIIRNPLHFNGEKYEIDFEDFEGKLKQGVKAFILCSPHNPVGRVWKKWELTKMAELCLQYNVLILADEIHADLVLEGFKHTPIASLSNKIAQQTITFMSPTKTFNLAGLHASFIVTPDRNKQKVMEEQLAISGFSMLNTMGITALEAAYKQGEQWLNQLLKIVAENKKIACKMIAEQTNGRLKIIDSEGTYLLWMDCKNLGMNDKELHQFMIHEAKVGLNPGSSYGEEGNQFMRINIACPTAILKQGIQQIITAVNELPVNLRN